MIEIHPYIDRAGRNPFAKWLKSLDGDVQARVIEVLARVELGNFSMFKGIGLGVFEIRLHFGPGYRVYCGKDGETLVLLLGGGTKRRQQNDIEGAKVLWQEYKKRKKEPEWH